MGLVLTLFKASVWSVVMTQQQHLEEAQLQAESQHQQQQYEYEQAGAHEDDTFRQGQQQVHA